MLRQVRTLRYETIQPKLLESEPSRFWDVQLPVCSERARLLRVERDGRVLLLDSGVPTPECDLGRGTTDWGDVRWLGLRAVLHSDTRVLVLPQEPGRYLGSIRNAIGLWTVFEIRRRPAANDPPGTPSQPPRTGQSATGSGLF
jgi:hypothetical protein